MSEFAFLVWVIFALLLVLAGTLLCKRVAWNIGLTETMVIILLLSLAWWPIAGGFCLVRSVMLVNVSLIGFALGGLFGFILTSHADEEARSVGRIRDWILGGLTGLTLVDATKDFQSLKRGLDLLANTHESRALTVGCLIVYGCTGFFAMFFVREVIWNHLFNLGRAKAAMALRRSISAVGKALDDKPFVDAMEGHLASPKPATEKTGALLKLVASAEELTNKGETLPDSTQEDLGRAYYHLGAYRKAAETLGSVVAQKGVEAGKGLLYRLADSMLHQGKSHEAAELLKQYVDRLGTGAKKLIGYYLLWDEKRLDESLRFSEEYLLENGGDSGALFNAACAAAQLFGLHGETRMREVALKYLRDAISKDATWRAKAMELSRSSDGDFASLQQDQEFLGLVS